MVFVILLLIHYTFEVTERRLATTNFLPEKFVLRMHYKEWQFNVGTVPSVFMAKGHGFLTKHKEIVCKFDISANCISSLPVDSDAV